MAKLSNKDFLTINENGIFLDGATTTTYRGVKISDPKFVMSLFNRVQQTYPGVLELQVLASKTSSLRVWAGCPSAEHGAHAWVRVILKDGRKSSWIHYHKYATPQNCAAACAKDCAESAFDCSQMRGWLFSRLNRLPLKRVLNPTQTKQCLREYFSQKATR